jgi:hypothetical protein
MREAAKDLSCGSTIVIDQLREVCAWSMPSLGWRRIPDPPALPITPGGEAVEYGADGGMKGDVVVGHTQVPEHPREVLVQFLHGDRERGGRRSWGVFLQNEARHVSHQRVGGDVGRGWFDAAVE